MTVCHQATPRAVDNQAATAGARHDFNNALQALGASLLRLKRSVAAGETADLGAMIAAFGDQVAAVRSLGAALTRTGADAAQGRDPVIAVGPFIRAMAHQVSALIDGKIRLEVQAAANSEYVCCDPAQLESAIRNLVLNARDAMTEGGVLILRGHGIVPGGCYPELDGAELPSGRYAAITVADTGCGMNAEMVRRCFDPFVTTKKLLGGTGLGLFQLRNFAVGAGGTIRLQSREGKGTEVTILLPAVEPTQQS